MNVVRFPWSWCLLTVPVAAVAAGVEPAIRLPCEPSRACAIEMARAAAYENERRREGSLGLMFGLLIIAEHQVEAGDIAGFTAIAPEARRAIEANRLKNPSSGPNRMDGRKMTAPGTVSSTAFSPAALVRA